MINGFFKPNDNDWDFSYFFKIFEIENEKYISIIFRTSRDPLDKPYLSWTISYYIENKTKLSEFILFDQYYQLAKIDEKYEYETEEYEPEEVLNYVNRRIERELHSIKQQDILKIDETISCGYYYGY